MKKLKGCRVVDIDNIDKLNNSLKSNEVGNTKKY